MNLSDHWFDLPNELIAQEPLPRREASQMLRVSRRSRAICDDNFSNFPNILKKGDLLVLNDTKVFPARLIGRTDTGAGVELFLVEETAPQTWTALARPGKRLKPGKRVIFDGKMSGEIAEKFQDGKVTVIFDAGDAFDSIVQEIGKTPLPPYIRRDDEGRPADRERYQTVFAEKRGAIAAPTAGLHFTENILEQIRARGVEIAHITLHVGYGTFEPVRVDDLAAHRVAPERFEVSSESAEKLERARIDGRRVVAVGTTTTRTLEYVINHYGTFRAANGRADLTILPGYTFKAVGALLTNFHLPESSLLVLVATFGGYQLIMDGYRHAVSSGYRFYSYGDCMFID